MSYITKINLDGTQYSTINTIKKLNIDGVLYDIGLDTSDATAAASHIRSGKTAYVNGSKITGTIPEYGPVTTVSTMRYDGVRIIAESPYGYYSNYDSNLKTIYYLPQNNVASAIGLKASVLKSGTTILGITGNVANSCGANFSFQSGGYTENDGAKRKIPDKADVWGGSTISNTRYATLPAGKYYVVGCCGYLTGGQGQGGKVYIAKSGALTTSLCDASITSTSAGSGRATYGTFYSSFTLTSKTTVTVVIIQDAGAAFGSFGAVTITKI